MEEKYSDLIERYFDNALNDVEREEVRELLNTNDAFKSEFELFEKANTVVSLYAQQELKDSIKEMDNSVISNKSYSKLRIAASLLIVGLVSLLLYAQGLSNEKLYSKHFALADDYVTDLDDEFSELEMAMEAYNKSAYLEASNSFQTILEKDPANQEARFYYGQSLLQMKDLEMAKNTFQAVSGSYSWEAQWYLALTHLRLNDEKSCEEVLETIIHYSNDEVFINKSKRLLKSLNSRLRFFTFS